MSARVHDHETVSARRVTSVLGIVVGAAVLGHLAIYGVRALWGVEPERMLGLWRLLHMGFEANFPSLVSTFNLGLASVLLMVVARHESHARRRTDLHWWGLALGFAVMALDEGAQLHEGLVGEAMIAGLGRGEGVGYYRWYLAYAPLTAALFVAYVPFLKRLPRFYAGRLIAAGALFVGGAVVLEMVEAYVVHGELGGKGLVQVVEETLEMAGVLLLIDTLVRHLEEVRLSFRIDFRAEAPGPEAREPAAPAPREEQPSLHGGSAGRFS